MESREHVAGAGIAQEMFDAGDVYEAYEPTVARPFLGWHRPRKQLVREQQWVNELTQMLDANPSEELRYLGLPGVDLLDLRYIREKLCEPRELMLRYLGFNSGARTESQNYQEMAISQDEVKRSRFVHPLSEIKGDDFALLGQHNSLAHRAAVNHGPFDVINIDLCDGFGAHPPARLGATYYDAVNGLCAIQARRTRPWLLLLTTRTDLPTIDPEVLERFLQKYRSNLAEHPDFTATSDELLGIRCAQTLEAACGTADGHLKVFLTSLSKWLIGISLANAPPTEVRLKSAVGYSIAGRGTPDMMSLAFLFTPTVLAGQDPLGLARGAAVGPNEGTLAVRALRRVAALRDADEMLENDPDLNARMIDETADLLQSARYDPTAYREWVNQPTA